MAKAKWERFVITTNTLQRKEKKLCDKKSIPQEYVEDIVLTATKEFLNHTNLTELFIYLAEIYNKNIEKDAVLESLINNCRK